MVISFLESPHSKFNNTEVCAPSISFVKMSQLVYLDSSQTELFDPHSRVSRVQPSQWHTVFETSQFNSWKPFTILNPVACLDHQNCQGFSKQSNFKDIPSSTGTKVTLLNKLIWIPFLTFTIHCNTETRKEDWPVGIIWEKTEFFLKRGLLPKITISYINTHEN